MKKLIIIRRASQVLFLLCFIYILWSTTYPLEGRLPSGTFFKINPLIMLVTSVSERILLSGAFLSVIMIMLTFVFGRFFCGWICPLGTAIDIAGMRARAGTFSNQSSELSQTQAQKCPSRLKFYILAAILIFSLFGIQVAWVLDPTVIMARSVSLNLIPALTFGIDRSFVFFIKSFGLFGAPYDLYRSLKASVLGINTYYFSHSIMIFAFFLFIMAGAAVMKRSWCRVICPLGAIYALAGRRPLLRRGIEGCISCGKCRPACRMGAIKDNNSYSAGECVLCMDCVYECAPGITKFNWVFSKKNGKARKNDKGITRRGFVLWLLASSAFLAGFRKAGPLLSAPANNVIRPPGVQREGRFLDRCIRCGNCMKVCITNGLQPTLLQSGISGIWTPQLMPEVGYCEYQCTLCGNVCPTGAIPKLTLSEKKRASLGSAVVDRSICLPWSKGSECLVCEEHCPVADKAIKKEKISAGDKALYGPRVDLSLCVGCGICQNKCPVRPNRAIKVRSIHSR